MNSETKGYNVYRGLQKPLIFKSLKGKFIYWGMGALLCSFLVAVVLSALVNVGTGAVGMILTGVGGLLYINKKQKKGLHSKTKSAGSYIITPMFKTPSQK